MSCTDIVNLCSDDELDEVDVKAVKLDPGLVGDRVQQEEHHKSQHADHHKSKAGLRRQASEENKSSNTLSTSEGSTSVLEQGYSPAHDTGVSAPSPMCPAPLCRQFWKAGNYNDGHAAKFPLNSGRNYLHVHPMFLHSNATSHKWAFGAVAELLDNAIDEIQNGATFVVVDKITNPRDGSPALLIKDNGGGMDPEAMRRCMSFGFSDKRSKSAIGQYGNGFKTSSMRLGADVIVFSRHLDNRILTQSIGLLSYTFLTQTGHDRIVVPMVDYEYNTITGRLEVLHGGEHFMSNLSLFLQWSPYSTEAELLKQFDDMDSHGTKIIIYNLWFDDDRNLELDFDSDPKDIRIRGDTKKVHTIPGWRAVNEQHIANRYSYSLRVYLSILYLRIPESFRIILRGEVVEHHNIADDLKYPEFILYRPQSNGSVEGKVITTIGFLKEAPQVNIHGFCVYHNNRLILPFWRVLSCSNGRGRGVVGVLEANFVEPTHNKQDLERTSLFQKLESRLKEMTLEYWDYHCALIGYQVNKKPQPSISAQVSSHCTPDRKLQQESSPVDVGTKVATAVLAPKHPAANSSHYLVGGEEQSTLCSVGRSEKGLCTKRKEHNDFTECRSLKRQAGQGTDSVVSGHCLEKQPVNTSANQLKDPQAVELMQENKKLRARCSEYEKRCEELNLKVAQLKSELAEVQGEYDRMIDALQAFHGVKIEKI